MHTRDFIPELDGKFLEWVRILFVYVRMNMTNWNITEMQLRPMEEQIALYEATYRRAEDPNRGKWLYFAARWENNRGKKGPWCEIMNTVIP
jgi:hypothetical protein